MSDTASYQRMFADLKRRNISEVAAVYGAVAIALAWVYDRTPQGLVRAGNDGLWE